MDKSSALGPLRGIGGWGHHPLRYRNSSSLSSLTPGSLILSEDHYRLKAWRGTTFALPMPPLSSLCALRS